MTINERKITLLLDASFLYKEEAIKDAIIARSVQRERLVFNTILQDNSFDPSFVKKGRPEDTLFRVSDYPSLLNSSMSVEVGCDEAGRGCLAGPVFAAAVVLPDGFYHPLLNDSKQMTETQRDELRTIIEKEAVAWSVVAVDAKEIDKINILNASITGMQRAISSLSTKDGSYFLPEMVYIDGNKFKPYRSIPYKTVVKGDAKMLCIAAASILAKTHRDEYMKKLAKEFPQYGWEKNVGYPTKEHRKAIAEYGVTPYHRMTYKLLSDEPTLF